MAGEMKTMRLYGGPMDGVVVQDYGQSEVIMYDRDVVLHTYRRQEFVYFGEYDTYEHTQKRSFHQFMVHESIDQDAFFTTAEALIKDSVGI